MLSSAVTRTSSSLTTWFTLATLEGFVTWAAAVNVARFFDALMMLPTLGEAPKS